MPLLFDDLLAAGLMNMAVQGGMKAAGLNGPGSKVLGMLGSAALGDATGLTGGAAAAEGAGTAGGGNPLGLTPSDVAAIAKDKTGGVAGAATPPGFFSKGGFLDRAVSPGALMGGLAAEALVPNRNDTQRVNRGNVMGGMAGLGLSRAADQFGWLK